MTRSAAKRLLAFAGTAALCAAVVNAPHLVALVRAGARFERGILVEREPSITGTEEAA
jgi:putative transposase